MSVVKANKLRIEVTNDTGTRVITLASGDQPMRLVLDETVLAVGAEGGADRVALQLVALGVNGDIEP